MSEQLKMFGATSGMEKAEPIAVADVIVGNNGRRYVVTQVEADAQERPVFVCTALDNGASCIVMEREVAYRSR